jgi:hypothetical protein
MIRSSTDPPSSQLIRPVPQRFDAGDDRAASIQLRLTRLSPKNYGTTRWNRYAYQQAAILLEDFSSILSGEGFDESERGESLLTDRIADRPEASK